MTKKTEVLVVYIPTQGKPRVGHIPHTLDSLRACVGGGWLEAVMLPPHGGLYVNEEGKLNGLAMNVTANALAYSVGFSHRDFLVGPAVLFGGSGPEEEDAVAWIKLLDDMGIPYERVSAGEAVVPVTIAYAPDPPVIGTPEQ